MTREFAYGTSLSSLNDYAIQLIQKINPQTVVDIGAGAGKYGELCRKYLSSDVTVIAVEACSQTCDYLHANNLYNQVDNCMLQDWLKEQGQKNSKFDLIICGDVLEHIHRKECFAAIDQALTISKNVIIQVPLRNLEQEAFEGNPCEEHVAYLLEEDFDKRYIIAEKHVQLQPNFHLLLIWIIGKRRNTFKDKIKKFLLTRFGRPMYLFMKKMGMSTEIELDAWREKLEQHINK